MSSNKINVNIYIHCALKRFYGGRKALIKPFWGTKKKCKNKNSCQFYLLSGNGAVTVNKLMLSSKINCVLQFIYWVSIYLLKINKRNTRTMCEICSNLTIKTPEQYHWRHSGVLCCWFQAHFTSYSSVFRVSLDDFEQAKTRLGSKSHHSRKYWYCCFVARKKRLIYCS